VILVDTSAWVAFTRADETPADLALTALIEDDADLLTTDIVTLELLAGARSPSHLNQLRQLLATTIHVGIAAGIDADQGAEIYRTCRRQGETPRQLNDCLIAAVAIRHDVPLLHADRDFEVMARHTTLQTLTR